MASSFLTQVPTIIYLIGQIKPTSILDVGKGFGKYGFLIHEYIGVDNKNKLNPSLTMKEQSVIRIDAMEIDEQLLLPHLNHFYNEVFKGNILEMYEKMNKYDLILMIDVIEHLDKTAALNMLKFFAAKKTKMIIATPLKFFRQHLYSSEYEEHISHWTENDFKGIFNVDYQTIESGVIYYLSPEQINIRGFGKSFIKKIRRIARAIKNDF
jgi:2-polyprenyl-3-methyl-5-hydroxy-6-metoxy-1,4-benzoquinol methylase